MRQDRNIGDANVFSLAAAIVSLPVSKRSECGIDMPPLPDALDVKRNVPSIFHESDSGRVIVGTFGSDGSVMRRHPVECSVLIRCRKISSSKRGNSKQAQSHWNNQPFHNNNTLKVNEPQIYEAGFLLARNSTKRKKKIIKR